MQHWKQSCCWHHWCDPVSQWWPSSQRPQGCPQLQQPFWDCSHSTTNYYTSCVFCTHPIFANCNKHHHLQHLAILPLCHGVWHLYLFLEVCQFQAAQENSTTSFPCKTWLYSSWTIPNLILVFISWYHISCYNCMERALYGQFLPPAQSFSAKGWIRYYKIKIKYVLYKCCNFFGYICKLEWYTSIHIWYQQFGKYKSVE